MTRDRKHQPETPPPPRRGDMTTALDGMPCMRSRGKDDVRWPRRGPPGKRDQGQKRFGEVMKTPTDESSCLGMKKVVDG